jgi:BirA family transcriptional regulator, biotin operon repressor / biotin---[acetyl-CoA-carboxylase] ligase
VHPHLPLTIDAIRSTLATHALGHRIELFDHVDSTNRQAFTLAQADVEHGTVVVAEGQTDGRGRLGRTWFSPPGVNLYCSIVIRKDLPPNRLGEWLSWLPLITALAAAETIETVAGVKASVKWPNDLLIGERKVGGILCESGTVPRYGPFQVIGIGINVNGNRDGFPHEIRHAATTIFHETGRVVDRNRLLSQLLFELEQCIEELAVSGQERIAFAYRQRCATLGQSVQASLAGGREFVGIAETVGPDGSLQVTQRPTPTGGRLPDVIHLRVADIIHLRPSQIAG